MSASDTREQDTPKPEENNHLIIRIYDAQENPKKPKTKLQKLFNKAWKLYFNRVRSSAANCKGYAGCSHANGHTHGDPYMLGTTSRQIGLRPLEHPPAVPDMQPQIAQERTAEIWLVSMSALVISHQSIVQQKISESVVSNKPSGMQWPNLEGAKPWQRPHQEAPLRLRNDAADHPIRRLIVNCSESRWEN